MLTEGRTIAAVSTPKGKGGVALIRISGEKAIETAEKCFRCRGGLSSVSANTAVYGVFYDDGERFDDGIATVFRAPNSFTGEDTVELCCHGGVLVTQKLLGAVLKSGACMAAAGEFTKRAFLNGKITLSQAEAVGGIIDAKTERALSINAFHGKGALSEKINKILDDLKLLVASVYAYIDYPDEDLTDVSVDEMKKILDDNIDKLKRLSESYKYGKAVSEGIKTAIIGLPNAGKSSVLNMLAASDRAIVTDIPGTTRDVITESVVVGDVLLDLSDTAGIRDDAGTIEAIGVKKSRECMENAELILFVVDGTQADDPKAVRLYEEMKMAGKPFITVVNKKDIASPGKHTFENAVEISALTGEGFDALARKIGEFCLASDFGADNGIILNARQNASVYAAKAALESARASLDSFTQDIACADIEEAIGALCELDGKKVSEEIVNEIFSHFCVGK